MFGVSFNRNGYVSASEMKKVFDYLADILNERFEGMEQEISDSKKQIKALQEELATERRLRLSMQRRG